MAIELLCRKIGMTRIFQDDGQALGVTVLEAGPNVVVQKKNVESDGYTALQLGFGERRESLFSKAEKGHFGKASVSQQRQLRESRVEADVAEGHDVGSEITCAIFQEPAASIPSRSATSTGMPRGATTR